MNILLLALAFLALCLGIAALAAIPFLIAIARRNEELASNLNVNTQIIVNRYNALYGPKQDPKTPPPPKPKGLNIYPLNRETHGPGTNDKDK